MVDAKGVCLEDKLKGMDENQLRKIAGEIDIRVSKETSRQDLLKQITWRLEWLSKSKAEKVGAAKP